MSDTQLKQIQDLTIIAQRERWAGREWNYAVNKILKGAKV